LPKFLPQSSAERRCSSALALAGPVPDLPGVLVYGKTWADAWMSVRKLARKGLEDRVKHGEAPREVLRASLISAT